MRTIPEREQRLLLFFLAVFVMGSAVMLVSRNYFDRVPLTATAAKNDGAVESSPSVGIQTRPGPRRLNPNYATEAELRSLPGIGSTLARRILRHRRDHIFFAPVDLLDVPGIGKATLEALTERFEFDSAPDANRGE